MMTYALPVNYDDLPQAERRLVREQYVLLQNGVCYYCGNPFWCEPRSDVKAKSINRKLFPPNFFKWPIHLHHSHDTGLTIGAVHAYCNAVLWQYEGE